MKIKKIFFRLFIVLVILYSAVCFLFYAFQEKIIFAPEKLPADFTYRFEYPFEEINIKCRSGNLINGALFKTENSKGIVVYFHGNAGSLRMWGSAANVFLLNHYDIFISDYAGYGKSKGKITEENLFADAQNVYDEMKKRYTESIIIVYGRSIGTGIAAKIASENQPKKLLLESPYYNLADLEKKMYPWLPSFLLKFPFRTDLYLLKVKCPVIIFHGTADEIVDYDSSINLQKLFKAGDELITIEGGHHNDLKSFEIYQLSLKRILK